MASANRVLLKLSGEWFAGEKEKGFDENQKVTEAYHILKKEMF